MVVVEAVGTEAEAVGRDGVGGTSDSGGSGGRGGGGSGTWW